MYTEYKNYLIGFVKDTLIVQVIENNRVKIQYNVPCENCDTYRFKLMKTKIKAMDSAKGLFCFMADCIKNDFMIAYVNEILNHITNNMRFYKV